ncbi:DinB family protein [Pedobacter punctiformis]|uniref:DinB family protein n=1 Tax=Pedobacter punctiformis TaxID=3004097 RepID=A0ABT4L447_9SPHI|nr:DinB family protein [Pedobacter sp. HCMS5-2]MCZ4242697.1 DinB family protein [Pedobacter sp. HCMS5-2]
MLTEALKSLFNRDLNKLKFEIESYKTEPNLWVIDKSILNPAGNLCLHLVGNLNTYIGAILGNTGYIRNRELEFSLKNIPKAELVQKIEETISVVNKTLKGLSDEDLAAEYPLLVFEEKTSSEFFLVHLTTHLAYHLGQINYHRRLLDI